MACQGNKEKKPASIKVSLEGNPTTGYGWYYELSTADIMELVSEDYVSDAGDDEEIVGIGGTFYFVFTAKKAGEVQITFSYKRIWEEDDPLESLVVRLKVNKDLSIQILGNQSENVEILP